MEQVGGGGNGKKTVIICMGPSPVKCIPLLRLEAVLPPKDPSSRDSAHGGPYRHGVVPIHGKGRRYPHGALHTVLSLSHSFQDVTTTWVTWVNGDHHKPGLGCA